MRPEFPEDVVRPAMPRSGGNAFAIPISDWRQLDSATPNSPGAENPTGVQAYSTVNNSYGDGAKILFTLEKPFRSRSSGWHGLLQFGGTGLAGRLSGAADVPGGSSGLLLKLRTSFIYESYDPSEVTWNSLSGLDAAVVREETCGGAAMTFTGTALAVGGFSAGASNISIGSDTALFGILIEACAFAGGSPSSVEGELVLTGLVAPHRTPYAWFRKVINSF